MADIAYPLWEDNGDALVEHYDPKYVTPERYQAVPIKAVVVLPEVEQFFGTRVCNILIIAQPVGWVQNGDGEWVEQWPPEGFVEAVARHIETYGKFTEYNTFVWIDRYAETLIVAATPDSRVPEMMAATSGRFEDVCDELADYGFHFMGEISSAVGPEFFYSTIDEFFQS